MEPNKKKWARVTPTFFNRYYHVHQVYPIWRGAHAERERVKERREWNSTLHLNHNFVICGASFSIRKSPINRKSHHNLLEHKNVIYTGRERERERERVSVVTSASQCNILIYDVSRRSKLISLMFLFSFTGFCASIVWFWFLILCMRCMRCMRLSHNIPASVAIYRIISVLQIWNYPTN